MQHAEAALTLCLIAGSPSLVTTNSLHPGNLSTTAQTAGPTAGATAGRMPMHCATATSGSYSTTVNDITAVAPDAASDRLQEDLSCTAMSIDTPSYARSLGKGQLGSGAGFAGSLFRGSQDLAQSMSIDGVQAEHISEQAAASAGRGTHCRLML